jgi:hypothetical protein
LIVRRSRSKKLLSAKRASVARRKKKLSLIEPPQVEFGANYKTAQIYAKGFEFAFMSRIKGVYQQICTFVYCKDFFHDLVWSFLNQKPWSIYGFKYDPKKDLPLDVENCVFAFRNTQYKDKEKDFHAQRESCQDFLNQIEKKIGLEPSRIFEVPYDGSPCWLVIGDKRWQIAPPMLGFFTLFIRIGFAHPVGESYESTLEKCKDGKIKIGDGGAGCNDPGYIKQSWKGLQALLTHGLDTFHPDIESNYPKELPAQLDLHNSAGPVNWTAGQAKKAMPRWYKHL